MSEDETDRLADVWQRLAWANRDGEAFSDGCKWFRENGSYAIHAQSLAEHRWEARFHRFISDEDESELFVELSRLLGSFLDHSRAVLNYATYQLACFALEQDPSLAGSLKPDVVEFPIYRDPKKFRDARGMKKWPDAHRHALEALQPYDDALPGLWLLNELAREYRHRVLHPAAILPAEDTYRVLVHGEPVTPEDLEIVAHERLSHGDVVMRFSLDNAPAVGSVHPQIGIAVGIDHPLCREFIGTSVFNQIRRDVSTVVDALEEFMYPQAAPS